MKSDAKRDRLLCLGWYRGAKSSDSESESTYFDGTIVEVQIGDGVGLDAERNSNFIESLA